MSSNRTLSMSKLALIAFAGICICSAVLSEDECQTIDDHCVGGYASLIQKSIKLTAQHKHKATLFAHEAPQYKDYVLEPPSMPTDASQQFTPDLGELCMPGLTNPSILPLPQLDEVWVVQRSLKKCLKANWKLLSILKPAGDAAFYNHVVFGRAALSNLRIDAKTPWAWKHYAKAPDPRLEGGNMTTCLEPGVVAAGRFMEGLEDPKLVSYNGKNFMIVVGAEAVPSPPEGTIIPHVFSMGMSSEAKRRSKKRPPCTKFGLQQYIAEIESVHPTIKLGPFVHLASPEGRWTDKNWSPFSWTPAGQEPRLMMVYDVHPHTIVQVNASTGHTQKVFSKASPAVTDMALKANINVSELHGGSGVARVENSGTPYNLAVMHLHGDFLRFAGDPPYRNWPYKFSTEPPFNIIAVGRELPFAAGAGIKFVSSVTLHNNTVIIGYGWGDRKARIWQMGLNEFESTFF